MDEFQLLAAKAAAMRAKMADDSTLTTLGNLGVGGGLATAGVGYGGRELGTRYLAQRYGDPRVGEGLYKTRQTAQSVWDSIRNRWPKTLGGPAPKRGLKLEMPTKLDAAMLGRLKGRAVGKGGLIAAGIGLPILALGKGVDAFRGSTAQAPPEPPPAEVAQAAHAAGALVPKNTDPIVRPPEAPPQLPPQLAGGQPTDVPQQPQLSHREEARRTIAQKAKGLVGGWWNRMHRQYA